MDMNHDGHEGHGSEEGTASCPMIMTFHAGHCERILWHSWVASTVPQFVFACIVIFITACLYEFIKFLRDFLLRHTLRKEREEFQLHIGANSNSTAGVCSNNALTEFSDKKYYQRIGNRAHLLQTLLVFFQVIVAYLLMLVFMTYNYWLCLATVLGLSTGFFSFGWIRHSVYDNECCG